MQLVGPPARKYRSAGAGAQAIPNSTWTAIGLDTISFDPAALFSGNNFVADVAGWYRVEGSIAWAPSANWANVYININSTTVPDVRGIQGSSFTLNGALGGITIAAGIIQMNATDFLSLLGFVSGAQNANTGQAATFLSAQRIA